MKVRRFLFYKIRIIFRSSPPWLPSSPLPPLPTMSWIARLAALAVSEAFLAALPVASVIARPWAKVFRAKDLLSSRIVTQVRHISAFVLNYSRFRSWHYGLRSVCQVLDRRRDVRSVRRRRQVRRQCLRRDCRRSSVKSCLRSLEEWKFY